MEQARPCAEGAQRVERPDGRVMAVPVVEQLQSTQPWACASEVWDVVWGDMPNVEGDREFLECSQFAEKVRSS